LQSIPRPIQQFQLKGCRMVSRLDPLRGDPRFEVLVEKIVPAQKSSIPSP
jgi:hypothetical protein